MWTGGDGGLFERWIQTKHTKTHLKKPSIYIDTSFETTEAKVNAYQRLIEQLPLPNQFLLLYLLDLLGVYAMHTETTLMDIPSLAVIFTPVSNEIKLSFSFLYIWCVGVGVEEKAGRWGKRGREEKRVNPNLCKKGNP